MTAALPIPRVAPVDGRERIPIRDCGERLVTLAEVDPDRVVLRPEYFLRGYATASPEAFARVGVAARLARAAAALPPGCRLVVLDAWRPLVLQDELFRAEKERLRAATPAAAEAELERLTRRYVSMPTADPASPPPHLTGGALDVTLERDGQPLEMGTAFDYFGPEAATRHLEEKSERGAGLSPAEQAGLTNRRLLYHCLTAEGFTNYREEWWHFDYGDQFWACIHHTHAIYGAAAR